MRDIKKCKKLLIIAGIICIIIIFIGIKGMNNISAQFSVDVENIVKRIKKANLVPKEAMYYEVLKAGK